MERCWSRSSAATQPVLLAASKEQPASQQLYLHVIILFAFSAHPKRGERMLKAHWCQCAVGEGKALGTLQWRARLGWGGHPLGGAWGWPGLPLAAPSPACTAIHGFTAAARALSGAASFSASADPQHHGCASLITWIQCVLLILLCAMGAALVSTAVSQAGDPGVGH